MHQRLLEIIESLDSIKHFWPRLARDLTLLSLPQVSSNSPVCRTDVADTYGISEDALSILELRPAFAEVMREEAQRVSALGHRAGFVLRSEVVAVEAVEKVHAILTRTSGLELKDVVKSVELLAKITGLGVPEEKASGPQVAVQINVPSLQSAKLAHLSGALS